MTAARPLRIGVMLRAVAEVDGAGVYIRSLLEALFRLDRHNQYVLFYANPRDVGLVALRANVRARVLRMPTRVLWDQVAVPIAVRRERLDVLFHHKFTIPLFAPCATVVQQRGAEYWIRPEFYDAANLLYSRIALPLYCRTATRVLTNSKNLARELERFGVLDTGRTRTMHAAAEPQFRPVTDADTIRCVRERYGLPEPGFLLMVAKGYARLGRGKRGLYPSKNIEGTVGAFRRLRDQIGHECSLVVAGPGIAERLAQATGITPADREWIVTPGVIAHADMPAVYSMAGGLAFISYHESFGIPLVEAMQCGCPVITSTAGACPEVVGGAAVVVDPDDSAAIESAIRRLLTDRAFSQELRTAGIARARDFSWTRSAAVLLDELERAARDPLSSAPTDGHSMQSSSDAPAA